MAKKDKGYVMLLRIGDLRSGDRRQCFDVVLSLLFNYSEEIRSEIIESLHSISEYEKLKGRRF